MEGFAVMLILFWLVPKLVAAGKKKQGSTGKGSAGNSSAARQTQPMHSHRPAPVMNRSAHRDFSAPEAPCIVCEQTGEDHFLRDKARRLAQLDEWLKIGLIDREEYRVLKDRYQRGI